MRTLGTRDDGRPWAIGVVDPEDTRRRRFNVRTMGSSGVATSGAYERGFVKNGQRYHHLLDATTGWPARGLSAVTVVDGTAFRAGRYSTAAFLLGAGAGLALLERTKGIEGALITERGEILTTKGMANLTDLPGALYAAHPLI